MTAAHGLWLGYPGPMAYRFSNLRLDPGARLLQRDGTPLEVPRRVFDCLVYLIENRSRAVGRDELIEKVWHRANVSDNQLAQTVLAARKLLDDDGIQQRMIRTVAGFGYHFVGEIAVEETELRTTLAPETPPPPAAQPVPVEQQPASAPTAATPAPIAAAASRWGSGLLLVTCGTLILISWLWWRGAAAPIAATPAVHTAPASVERWTWVLPAQIANPDDAWARIGIATLIAERLRHNGLVVVPTENVLTRIGKREAPYDAEALRAELGANQVIVPSIGRNGAVWRVELLSEDARGQTRAAAEHTDLLVAGQRAADELSTHVALQPEGTATQARFDMIKQLIRSRDFEAARAQLARLPESERGQADTRILEIELEMEQGRMDLAQQLATKLRASLDTERFPALAGRLGLLEISLMRHRGASGWEKLAAETVDLLQRHGTPRDFGSALLLLGSVEAIAGRYDMAQKQFMRARQLFLGAADELGAVRAAGLLAQVAVELGRNAEAVRQLEDCVRVYARYAAIGSQFLTLRNILSIQFGMLRWDDAHATSERMRALLPLLADTGERVNYLRARALLMLGIGRTREAAALLDENDRERARGDAGSEVNRSNDLYRLQVWMSQGRHADVATQAMISYQQLEQEMKAASLPRRDHRDLALYLGLEARRRMRVTQPDVTLDELPSEVEALAEPVGTFAWLARGHYLVEGGDFAGAETAYRQGLRLATEANRMSRIVSACDALVHLLLVQDKVDAADQVLVEMLARDPELPERDFDSAVLLTHVRKAQADVQGWHRAAQAAARLAGERPLPPTLLPPAVVH